MNRKVLNMRYPYFDNAKAILIFLVVLGHFLIEKGEVGDGIYWLIYSFHMPAFIFIAGYFSKKESWKKAFFNVLGRFFLPYLIFQGIYSLYNHYFFDKEINNLAYANFALWFLLAMIYWKLSLQVIIRWKWTALIFIVLYLAHRFLLEDLNYFSIGRAIYFSLFFYLGYFVKNFSPAIITVIKKIPYRSVIFPFFGMSGLVFSYMSYQFKWIDIETKWFYGKFDSFNNLRKTYSISDLLLNQIEVTTFSFIIVIFFLLIVPVKKHSWTSIGTTTLTIYLLHGFIRNFIVYQDLLIEINTWYQLIEVAVMSLFIVYILSRKPFKTFIHFTSSLLNQNRKVLL